MKMETALKVAKKVKVVTSMAKSSPMVTSKHMAMRSSRTTASIRKERMTISKRPPTVKKRAKRAAAITVKRASLTMVKRKATRISTE